MADAPRFSVSGDQIVDTSTGKPVSPDLFNRTSTPQEKAQIGRDLASRSLMTNQEGEGGSATVDEDLASSSTEVPVEAPAGATAPTPTVTPEPVPVAPERAGESVRPAGAPPSLNEFLAAARPENPQFDDREIAVEYRRLYPEASKFYPAPAMKPWIAKAKEANPQFDEAELKSYYTDIYGAPSEKTESSLLRRAADIPIGLAKGVAGLPGSAIGLADIPTSGGASAAVKGALDVMGKGADALGLPAWARPSQWSQQLGALYSPETKENLAAVHQQATEAEALAKQEGAGSLEQIGASALGAVKGVASHPGALIPLAAENYAGMKLIAMGVAKVLSPFASELNAAVKAGTMTEAAANEALGAVAVKASAIGEGLLTAGQVSQGIQEKDPNADFAHRLSAAVAGLFTGGVARAVGAIPGLGDVPATMATAALGRSTGLGGGALTRVGKGVLSEGILQEPIQSGQEAAFENIGASQPYQAGVGEQIALGAATGGALGGTMAGISGEPARSAAPPQPPPEQPPSPMERVAPVLQATSVDEAISTAAKLVDTAPITSAQLDQAIGVPQVAAPAPYTESHLAADQVAFTRLFEKMADEGVVAVTKDAATGQAVYDGSPIRVVDPRTLPATTPPEAGLSQEKLDALSVMAQAFGKRIVVFQSGENLPNGAFWQSGDPSRIYLSQETTHEDAFTVFAHEAMHTMHGTPFYEAYKRTIYESRTPEAKALLKLRHGEQLSDTQLLEEAAADIGSTELQKPEMWEKVFANLRTQVGEQQAKVEVVSFIDSLKQIIQRIKGLISTRSLTVNQKTLTELYVKDLEKVQDALAEAVGKTLYDKRFATPEQAKAVGKLTLAKRPALDRTLLPNDVVETFSSVAQAQRGAPEAAMREVQNAVGGGVLSHAVEHTGDLIHRMTEGAKFGVSGKEYVREKVNKVLNSLTHAYGFEKEHGENLAANAEYYKKDVETYRQPVDAALKRYVAEHKALPVYNRAQWLARASAVAVGEMRIKDAVAHLKALKQMVESADFGKEAFAHTRRADRTLQPYLQPIPGKLIGIQKTGSVKIPDFELYNIEVDIPGHPKDSTVTSQTMAEEGYRIVPSDLVSAKELKEEKRATAQKTLEAAKKAEKAEPTKAGAVLNIGLNVNDGSTISAQAALSALKLAGAKVLSHTVRTSNTEPTLIAEIETPLSAEKATALSRTLKQDAIAQRLADGTGALYGPQAEKWGPFNPEYFLGPEEKPTLSPKPTSGDALARLAQALPTTMSRQGTKFLLPDGTRLTWNPKGGARAHFSLAESAGVWLDEVIRDGGIRYVWPDGVELGRPLTTKQAEAIVDDWATTERSLTVDIRDNLGSVVVSHNFDVLGQDVTPSFLQDWVNFNLEKGETPRFSPKSTAKLTHYSAQKNLTDISPKFHGTGQIGAEARRQMNEGKAYIPRSFFYRAGTKIEPRFKGLTKYTVEVPESSLVDLSTLTGTPTEREQAAKRQGYKGFYNSESSMPNVVAMFEPVSVSKPTGTITHAFMLTGEGLPSVTFVAVEGQQNWHKEVIPHLERIVKNLSREVARFAGYQSNGRMQDPKHFIHGTNGEPVSEFTDVHARGKFNRIILHDARTETMFKPGEIGIVGEGMGPRFSPKVWFSGLGNMLSEKMPAKASVEQVRNLLKSPGVKQDEVKWTGIQDYLDKQTGPVDKHNLLAWLAAHNVEIEEVTKREYTGEKTRSQLPDMSIQEFSDAWNADGTHSEFPGVRIVSVDDGDNYEVRVGDQWLAGDHVSLDQEASSTNAFNSFNHASEAAYEYLVAEPIRREAEQYAEEGPQTRYEGYKEPGGTDYTELLLTWKNPASGPRPNDKFEQAAQARYKKSFDALNEAQQLDIEGDLGVESFSGVRQDIFKSQHFDEPDILAHVRFDMRTDAEGKNVLFLEEVQSDWHEQGREKGYKLSEKESERIVKEIAELSVKIKSTNYRDEEASNEASQLMDRRLDLQQKLYSGIPDAPFSKTWPELVMKRMLRYAAEHNVDRLAWTTGTMQNARYWLSKHIDRLIVMEQDPGRYLVTAFRNGNYLKRVGRQSVSDMEGLIGKELTQKVLNKFTTKDFYDGLDNDLGPQVELSGLDLEMGGSGMKYFYDQMLPKFLEKYLKRFGTKVGTTQIDVGEYINYAYTGPHYSIEELVAGRTAMQSARGDLYQSPFTHRRMSHPINTVTDESTLKNVIVAMREGMSFEEAFRHHGSIALAKIFGGEQTRIVERDLTSVHAIDITAPMKDSVLQGQPLFAPKPKPAPTFTVDQPGTLDRVIRILQDKAIDIKRVVESVQAAGLALPDELNPVLKEEMYMKRSEQRASDFTNDELRPLVKQMQLSKMTLERVDQYALARHIITDKVNAHLQSINPDLAGAPAYDRLAGMTDQEAQAILSGPDAKVLESLAKRIDAMVEKTRDLMVDYGLEKQSTIDAWRKTYQHYVPLHREGFEEEGHPTGTGRSVRGSTVKGRTGSGLGVTNVLANVAQARDQIITRGEKQRPVIAMAGLLMLHPNPEIATLDKPAQIQMTDPQTGLITTVPGNLTNYTVPTVRRYDPVDRVVKTYPDPMYKGRDNVVNFRVDGVDYAIVFNERNERAMEAAKAFKELETPKLNGIMAAVAPYTRYLASINTQYNPVFGIVNFVRDAQFAMIALDSTPLAGMKAEVLNTARKSLAGIYQDARAVRLGRHPNSQTAQMWERFQHVGGPTGYRDLFFSSTDRGAEIERMLKPNDLGLITGPQALGKRLEETWLLQTLSDYNTTMENSIRLGVFTTAVQHGMSDIQAASYAKNITVNFNKKGQIGAQMGSLFAFFNANVQGTARIAETVFERTPTGVQLSAIGKKIVVGGMLAGILQTFVLAISGFGDEEPPEYIKVRNLVIPVPGTKAGYLLLPMPLGFNLLPNIGRAAAEAVRAGVEGKDINPLKRGTNLIGAIYGTFSPLGGTGGPIQELLPTVADPIAAVVSNKDWTGKSISKEDVSTLDPTPGHTRTRDTASFWATFLSKGINWATGGTKYTPGVLSPSPDAIDYLIEQVTGGIGRELSKGSQVLQAAITGEEVPFHKVPLLGRFAGSASGSTATRSTFYDNVKAVNLAYREFEGRAKDRTGDAHEFLRTHPEGRLREAAISIERTIGQLNKVKKDLVEKGAPRAEIRLREAQITGLMNRFNQTVEMQRKGMP